MKSFTKETVYSKELINIEFALELTKTQQFSIIIFTNSQAAIRIIKFSKQQFDQFILQRIIMKLDHFKNVNKAMYIH